MTVSIAVLVSGGGTNLQALIDAQKKGALGAGKIVLTVSSGQKAYALVRAGQNGIRAVTVSKKDYNTAEDYDAALLDILLKHQIQLVVLAGYLSFVGEKVINAFRGRIINIHPSLIPSFCGAGFYGLKVHEAALRRGVKVTGATVHHVTEVIDGGEIILQKAVDAAEGDTPETLQKRVMEQAEWVILPRAVRLICDQIEKGECDNEQEKGTDQRI